jgi:hypothetical protein
MPHPGDQLFGREPLLPFGAGVAPFQCGHDLAGDFRRRRLGAARRGLTRGDSRRPDLLRGFPRGSSEVCSRAIRERCAGSERSVF